tara:strand:+ start:1176 stop:1640 length:465 start_codon:yes stop_codon:yes gene_type:complete
MVRSIILFTVSLSLVHGQVSSREDHSQLADSLLKKTFPFSQKILHKAPSPFFKGRPYTLEVFVGLAQDSVEYVSLFFKTDTFIKYREMPLEQYRGRLRFKYDPQVYPGDELQYFFIAVVKNGGIYAAPVNRDGRLTPVKIRPVDPMKYYENLIR